MSGPDDALVRQLERAQRLGFLGPGPVEHHLRHTAAFLAAAGEPARALDLGSGGGVPGLVLATRMITTNWVLLDASERRTTFLRDAVTVLDLGDRVGVVTADAETAAHDPRWRGAFDLVVARGFGPPPIVAECAAGFLRAGGRLVVSEPPSTAPTRWDAAGLAGLGLRDDGVVRAAGVSVRRLSQVTVAPSDVPRRHGVPARQPRW